MTTSRRVIPPIPVLLAWLGALIIATSASAQVAKQTVITTTTAPVFATPDDRQSPLRVAKEGSILLLVESISGWYHVEFNDPDVGRRLGYVQQRFARLGVPPTDPAQPLDPSIRDTSSRASAPVPRTQSPAAVRVAQSAPNTSTQPARLRKAKIRGYVTEFRSPTDFDIEDYRITREGEFVLDFENASPDVTFQLQDVRVGVELETEGLLNEQSGELRATGIKVDLEQFKPIRQTAFVSIAPQGIQLLNGNWAGELRADGQVIRVTNSTAVLFKPTAREKKLARVRTNAAENDEFVPLRSLDQVTVGMEMTYEGIRDRETGSVMARRVEFASNDLEEGEGKLWKSFKTSIKPAEGFTPGELKIDHIGKYRLLPAQEVQRYVASIGQRLVPWYQADMQADDPRKIPFQFHVVMDPNVNAFATANGIVLVNSGFLMLLENEAQLAAVLGHEIAHATHEHTWRQQQYRKKTQLGIALAGLVASAYGLNSLADMATMVRGAIVNGYSRSLENQSDRVGLQYMTSAGYDPREAPMVWKLMAQRMGVSSTNFFWSTHDNHATRRSYLMNELKNNYRDVEFASLQTRTERYAEMKQAVANALSGKRTIKVTQ